MGFSDSPLRPLAAELRQMRLRDEYEQVLNEVLARAAEVLAVRLLVLFHYDSNEEQLLRWDCVPGAVISHGEVPPVDMGDWITLGHDEEKQILWSHSPLARRLGANLVAAVRPASTVNVVRLLAVDPRQSGPLLLDDLVDFARELTALLNRSRFLARTRRRAIEDERNRVAQDFHDGPLQTFLALDVQLQFIRRLLNSRPEAAAAEIERLQGTLKQQSRELREILQEMRPIDIERMGLAGLLRQLADDLHKTGQGTVNFMQSGDGPEPKRHAAREVFQIAREATNNARKHGKATHIVITLENRPDALVVTVDDNGGGFPFSGKYTLEELDRLRLGPVSIKQRARQLGASLQLESTPGSGSRVSLRLMHGQPVTSRAADDWTWT